MKKFNHVDFDLKPDLNSITQDDGKRFYEAPNGKQYKSVTTILSNLSKDSIQKWRNRVGEEEANRISSKATKRGTACHSIIEEYIQNSPDCLKDKTFDLIDTFKNIEPIIDDHLDNIYAIETALWSDEMEIAGRVDCIAEWDGELSVIDWKTSRKPKKEEWIESYFLQSTCYAIMFEEIYGISINKIVIVISVDGDTPQVFEKDPKEYYERLMDVLEIYG